MSLGHLNLKLIDPTISFHCSLWHAKDNWCKMTQTKDLPMGYFRCYRRTLFCFQWWYIFFFHKIFEIYKIYSNTNVNSMMTNWNITLKFEYCRENQYVIVRFKSDLGLNYSSRSDAQPQQMIFPFILLHNFHNNRHAALGSFSCTHENTEETQLQINFSLQGFLQKCVSWHR